MNFFSISFLLKAINANSASCQIVDEAFDLKIKSTDYSKSNPVTAEISLTNKILHFGFPETCTSTFSKISYSKFFEINWILEDQINLLDHTKNKTYSSTEFCLETIYNPNSKKNATLALICDGFCTNESNVCVQFCCPKGKFEGPNGVCIPYKKVDKNTDWKPRVLKEAERRGSGRGVYGVIPKCSDLVSLDSFDSKLPLNILQSGNLDWGKQSSIYRFTPVYKDFFMHL